MGHTLGLLHGCQDSVGIERATIVVYPMLIFFMLCLRWRLNQDQISLILDPVPTDVQYGSAGLLFQWWEYWQEFWYFEPSGASPSECISSSKFPVQKQSAAGVETPISASQRVFSCSVCSFLFWSSTWEFTCLVPRKIRAIKWRDG